MKLRLGRAAAALLFLAAQSVPGLHAALEAEHEVHSCCSDQETRTHFDACGDSHDEAPCSLCVASRSAAAVVTDSADFRIAPETDVRPVLSNAAPVDPFHVETPDSRGPPA